MELEAVPPAVKRRSTGSQPTERPQSAKPKLPAQAETSLVKKMMPSAVDFESVTEQFFQSIDETFHRYDKDGSGAIDQKELQAVLTAKGYELTLQQVDELLHEVDVDGGKTLDIEEFKTLLRMWTNAAEYKILDSVPVVTSEHIEYSLIGRIKALIPDAPWRWIWELLIQLIYAYFWVSVCASHIWITDNRERFFRATMYPDIACSVILASEILFRLNLAEFDGLSLIHFRQLIMKRYFRGWFWIDLLSTLPWRLFFNDRFPREADTPAYILNHLKLLAVLRSPTLFQSSGLQKVSLRYVSFHFGFLPFFRLFLLFICTLTLVAAINVNFFRFEIRSGLRDNSTDRMAFQVYWAMYVLSGVGYGDFAPLTHGFRVWACFLFILSMLIGGYFISAVVGLISETDVDTSRKDRLVTTLAVLRFFEVPEPLVEEILQFQNHILNTDLVHAQSHIVSTLPQEIQTNIIMQSRVPLLRRVHIFGVSHVSTLVQIGEQLEAKIGVPEQAIVYAGTTNSTLHIVNYGFLDLVDIRGAYVATIRRGDYFGECNVIRDKRAWVDRNRNMNTEQTVSPYTFVCLTYCDLYLLTPERLAVVKRAIPRFAHTMNAMSFLAKEYILSDEWKVRGTVPIKPEAIAAHVPIRKMSLADGGPTPSEAIVGFGAAAGSIGNGPSMYTNAFEAEAEAGDDDHDSQRSEEQRLQEMLIAQVEELTKLVATKMSATDGENGVEVTDSEVAAEIERLLQQSSV